MQRTFVRAPHLAGRSISRILSSVLNGRLGDHLSGPYVSAWLVQPTRDCGLVKDQETSSLPSE